MDNNNFPSMNNYACTKQGESIVDFFNVQKCKKHIGQDVLFICEDCYGELMCPFCLTDNHKGHNFEHIENATPKKRDNLAFLLYELEHERLPQLEQQLEFTDRQIECNETEHKIQTRKIKRTGDNLKHETDIMTASLISLCEEKERMNGLLLYYHKERLQEQRKQTKAFIEQGSQTLVRGRHS